MNKDKQYWESEIGKWGGNSLVVVSGGDSETGFIVEWDFHAEGMAGEFDSSIPLDEPLLRFTVLVTNPKRVSNEVPANPPKLDECLQIANGSFCTHIPVDISRDELRHYTETVMIPALEPLMKDRKSIKKVCEDFSFANDIAVEEASKGRIIPLTVDREFYTSGAYLQGVQINGKKYLIVTKLETDTFCDGLNCDKRMEEEYGLS